jgi:hypothetical protein
MPRYDDPSAEGDDAWANDPDDQETAGLAEQFCQGLTEEEQEKLGRVLGSGSVRNFAALYLKCASRFEVRQARQRVARSRW